MTTPPPATSECGETLTDHTGTSVSCTRRPGHKDDHGRGYLRWANSGPWFSRFSFAEVRR